MGDTSGEGTEDEQPAHKVTLSTFSIAKTETTVAQYKIYLKARGKQIPPAYDQIDDRYPVTMISRKDADDYCDWLSDHTGHIYRLPTEAQWEFAARGGNLSKGFRYSGAQTLDLVGWYNENSKDQIHPVAQKKANELGLFDMSGNLPELCRDQYRKYTQTPQINPSGTFITSRYPLTHRGGSYARAKSEARVSFRFDESREKLNILDDLINELITVTKENLLKGQFGFRVVMVK